MAQPTPNITYSYVADHFIDLIPAFFDYDVQSELDFISRYWDNHMTEHFMSPNDWTIYYNALEEELIRRGL